MKIARLLFSPVRPRQSKIAETATVFLVATALLTARSAHATPTTWLAAPPTADWVTGTNWLSGSAPGALGTTTNQDTATFLTNTNGNGTTNPVVIDANRNIKSIVFGVSGSTPASFTIGTTIGNPLLLSSAGSISLSSGITGTNITETVNAPLVLEPLTNTTAGTYSFSNGASTASNIMVFGGTVTGGTTSARITLTLTGANTGNNEVKGIISDGNAAGGMAVSKTSSGLWILSGANTYTGGTTITQGTLSVGTTGNLGASSSGVTFDGGTLQITGTALTSLSGLGHAVTFNAGKTVGLDISAAANTFTFDQALGGTNALTKLGAGTLNVTGANNYSGITTVSAGTLELSGTNNTVGTTTVNGTLLLNNTTANNGGLASGLITANNAAINSLVANLSISNALTITGTTTIGGSNSLTLNGVFTDSGSKTLSNSVAAGNTLTLAGTVNLSATTATGTMTISGTGVTNITGAIQDNSTNTGAGSVLFLNGTGATTISGANTYSGGTIIAAGSGPGAAVNVTSIGSVGGASSNLGTAGVLTIGNSVNNGKLVYNGTSNENADRVVNLGGTTGASIIDQSGSAALKFTSNFTSTGLGSKTLTLQGSTAGTGEVGGAIVDAAAGSTTLTANFATNATSITLASVDGLVVGASITGTGIAPGTTITGINTSTKVVTLSTGASGAGAAGQIETIAGVTNLTSLTKGGTGTWTLSGANTYSGGTTISAGTLNAANTSGLGANPAVSLAAATLGLLNNGTGSNGTIVFGPGSGYNVTTTGSSSTPLINVGNNTANTGNTIQLGSLALASPSLTVTNANGYNLNFSGASTMAGSRSLINNMTNGATILASLASQDATARTVTFNGASANAVTSVGAISQNGANALSVTQSGSGTLILTGANSYTGATAVTNGSLLVNGSTNAASAVTVTNAGTVLGGKGTIGGAVAVGGGTTGAAITGGTRGSGGTVTIDNVGTLTTGALTLTSTAVFHADILDAAGTAGVSYDQVAVKGVVGLGSSTLELNVASGLTFAPGQKLVLIDNESGSAIGGIFGGLSQGAAISANGYTFNVNYSGGDGNDFELDVAAVPEPATVFGALGIVGVLGYRERRRLGCAFKFAAA